MSTLLEEAQRKVDAASRKASRRRRRDSAADDFLVSEDALALDFVAKHGQAYRWSPGMGWMVDAGDHWQRDDELSRYDLARQIVRAVGMNSGDEKQAARIGSAKTVNAIVTLAQSDPRIVTPVAAWDADPMVLNTPNGIVDLRTGEFRDRTPGELHTRITRVGPWAKQESPTWNRFLLDVFCGDRELIAFMQRLLGYLLTGLTKEQKLFFWHGLGANGKSTLLDLVLWVVGTYGLKLPATVLMHTNMERHSTELAQLQGKRLAVSSELDEGQHWAESRIKELTGDEELTARFMRQDNFTFRMTQKHVIVGNYKPRLRGGDAALARRFVLVPFNARFDGQKRDAGMLDKLRAEAPAILAWMIHGAVDWAAHGLVIPASVAAASADYLRDNDDLAQWLEECCVREGEAKAGDLYTSFSTWKKARGEHPPSQTAWGSRITALPGITKRVSNGVRYSGVRLSAIEQERLYDHLRR
jgi:putative DNA primase/helicase